MTAVEILQAYRGAVLERMAIERQIDQCTPLGAPGALQAQRYDRVGRGTNHATAAALQCADGYAERLEAKRRELTQIEAAFEGVLTRAKGWQVRLILRRYYGLGDSDAAIAADLDVSREWVSRLRKTFLREISGEYQEFTEVHRPMC